MGKVDVTVESGFHEKSRMRMSSFFLSFFQRSKRSFSHHCPTDDISVRKSIKIINGSIGHNDVYSVKNKVYRIYDGHRSLDDLMSYVEEQKWESVEPVAWWRAPSSPL